MHEPPSEWCSLAFVWERSFLAVSVLLGATIEDALLALPDGTESRGLVGDLAHKLRDPRRATRAQGLATVAQEVALAISEVTLR
jgi:hypothetical protein